MDLRLLFCRGISFDFCNFPFFRFTPIPFGLQNAIFAISGIPFGHFAAATWLGLLPEAVMWNYFGYAAKTLSDLLSKKTKIGTTQKLRLELNWVQLSF